MLPNMRLKTIISFYYSKHANFPTFLNPLNLQRTLISNFPPDPTPLQTLCANGRLREALLEMVIQGLETKFNDYDMLLDECVNQRAVREGQIVHAHMIKTCYLPPVYLGTRLIVLYAKCACLGDARKMLDEMTLRNVVSWTAMISAYSQRGYASEALNLFVQMLRSGIL